MKHFGSLLCSTVAVSIDDHVVGVHVESRPCIFPRIGADVTIPQCSDQHIIRTKDSVVVVEVQAQVTVWPRTLSLATVEATARDRLLKALEEDNITPTPRVYALGLKALTRHLVHRMQQYGVKVT